MRYTCIQTISNLHHDSVNALAFSPDGAYIASGGNDGCIFLLETRTGGIYREINVASSITSLLWSQDGQRIFAGCSDGLILAMNPHMLNHNVSGLFHILVGVDSQVQCLSLSPQGKLAAGAGGTVVITSDLRFVEVDRESDRDIDVITVGGPPSESNADVPKEVRSVAFIKGGSQILITYLEHGVHCWNIEERSHSWKIKPRCFRIGFSAVDSDKDLLVCSNLYDGFDIYSILNGRYLRTITTRIIENVPLPVIFVNSGAAVLLGSSNGEVRIANPLTGHPLHRLPHENWDIVQSLAYHHGKDDETSSEHVIVTACSEKKTSTYIKIWIAQEARMPKKKSTKTGTLETGKRSANLVGRFELKTSGVGVVKNRRISWHNLLTLVLASIVILGGIISALLGIHQSQFLGWDLQTRAVIKEVLTRFKADTVLSESFDSQQKSTADIGVCYADYVLPSLT